MNPFGKEDRFRWVIVLESRISSHPGSATRRSTVGAGRMTAAATSGPANAPAPNFIDAGDALIAALPQLALPDQCVQLLAFRHRHLRS